MPTIKTTSDDPPKLINGSGSPVGGSKAVMTAMFKSALVVTQIVIPAAINALKASGALRAI
jgi:hypothetical protein